MSPGERCTGIKTSAHTPQKNKIGKKRNRVTPHGRRRLRAKAARSRCSKKERPAAIAGSRGAKNAKRVLVANLYPKQRKERGAKGHEQIEIGK